MNENNFFSSMIRNKAIQKSITHRKAELMKAVMRANNEHSSLLANDVESSILNRKRKSQGVYVDKY